MRSVAGAAHDVFVYLHSTVQIPHNGKEFSASTVDNDELVTINCAHHFGGGSWFTKCGVFIPTISGYSPLWSVSEGTWYAMKNVHLMIKLQ